MKDHSFNKWRVMNIKSELEGRRALVERGVEYYWDMALSNKVMQDDESDDDDEAGEEETPVEQ